MSAAKWSGCVVLLLLLPALSALATEPPSVGGGSNRSSALLRGPDLALWRGSDGGSVDYAIVGPKDWAATALAFGTWKTQSGTNAAYFGVEDIVASYAGRDDAARIHSFLQELAQNESTLSWLLLLGDTDLVPTRHLYTGAHGGNGYPWIDSYFADSNPSDYYFAGLDSTWDNDGDEHYGELGEEDWLPNLYVGRLPVDTVAQAQAKLTQAMDYEVDPQTGSWSDRIVMAPALYDIPNIVQTSNDTDDWWIEGEYEYWQDNSFEALSKVQAGVPPQMQQVWLADYNQTYGGNWTMVNDTLNQTELVALVNGGVGIVASASHGWIDPSGPSGNAPIHYNGNGSEVPATPQWGNRWKSIYTFTDATTASNGGMLPFWYSSACFVGNYSQPTPATERTFERFFTNTDGGVIGLVAASHADYRGELGVVGLNVSDGDWLLMELFFSIFFNQDPTYKGDQQPGKSLYLAKWAYTRYLTDTLGYSGQLQDQPFARVTKTVYNLLGDPEVVIWSGQPTQLALTTPDDVINDTTQVTVTVTEASGGAPVPNATVTAAAPHLFATGRTDAAGEVTLQLQPGAPETVTLTATAIDHLPAQTSFAVLPRPADLHMLWVNATPTVVAIGEGVTLTARLANDGETDALSVPVAFYDGNPTSGGELLGSSTIGLLSAFTNTTVTLSWEEVPVGSHIVYARADPAGTILDGYPGNEQAVAPDPVVATGIDLALTAEDLWFIVPQGVATLNRTDTVGSGTLTTAHVRVHNGGTANASVVFVRLWEGLPGAGGTRIGGQDVGIESIPAGGSAEATFPWNVSGSGSRTVLAQIDPLGIVAEIDEGNNEAQRVVRIDLPPTQLAALPELDLLEDNEEHDVLQLGGYVIDSDSAPGELTFALGDVGEPAVNLTVDRIGGQVDALTTDDWSGSTTATFVITDGIFVLALEVDVVVAPVNDQPLLPPILAQQATAGQPWHLLVNASDVDGDTLTFRVASDLVTIETHTGELSATPDRDDAGLHLVTVTVSDGAAEAAATFTLTVVVPNQPPVFGPLNSTLQLVVGTPFTLQLVATDPDIGDVLTFGDDSPLLNVDSRTGRISFAPSASMVGSHLVTFTVADALDARDSVSVTLEVKPRHGPDDPGGPGFSSSLLPFLMLLVIIVVTVVSLLLWRRQRTAEAQAPPGFFVQDEAEMDRRRAQRFIAGGESGGDSPWAPTRTVEDQAAWEHAAEPAPPPPARQEEEVIPADDGRAATPTTAATAARVAGGPCPKCGAAAMQWFAPGEGICNKCGNAVLKR